MKLAFYDTETTGLPLWDQPSDDVRQPHIVQIGVIEADEAGAQLSEASIIVQPTSWTIPQEVIDLHGITNERAMAEGVMEKAALQTLPQLIGAEGVTRVAFNEPFDARIVRIALKRYFGDAAADAWKAAPAICVMKMAANIMNKTGKRTVSLAAAYQHFIGKPLEGAHDALTDARACMDIYFAIQKREQQTKLPTLPAAPEPSTALVALAPIDRAALALQSVETKRVLLALAAANRGIVTVTNKDGREQAHAAYMVLRRTRVEIEQRGKDAREDAKDYHKSVVAVEDELVSLIEPEEKRLKGLRDAWDDEQERIKQKAIDDERARVAAIDREIEEIRNAAAGSVGKSAEAIADRIREIEEQLIDEVVFMERADIARQVRDETLTAMRQILSDRQAFEAEQVRLAEERRRYEEQVKLDREAAEQRQREEDERRRIEGERLAEERRKLELERAEQKRLADEHNAKVRAEEAEAAKRAHDEEVRIAAEERRILTARRDADEQMARERKAIEDERAAIAAERAALTTPPPNPTPPPAEAVDATASPSSPTDEATEDPAGGWDDDYPGDEAIVNGLVMAYSVDPDVVERWLRRWCRHNTGVAQ